MCRRELLVGLPGGCEAWVTVELHGLTITLATEGRRPTVESLNLSELQTRYPVITRAVAREVAEMISGQCE
jgi:hypothetical protein